MNIIKRIFLFFKNIFSKKEIVKMLDEPNPIVNSRNNFIKSLHLNTTKNKRNKVETLVCPGDGLGIQNNISY